MHVAKSTGNSHQASGQLSSLHSEVQSAAHFAASTSSTNEDNQYVFVFGTQPASETGESVVDGMPKGKTRPVSWSRKGEVLEQVRHNDRRSSTRSTSSQNRHCLSVSIWLARPRLCKTAKTGWRELQFVSQCPCA